MKKPRRNLMIDLYRERDSAFQFEYFGIWEKVLQLARLYGWHPAGTVEPPDWQAGETQEGWLGEYDLYLGELVRAEDAHAMADALEQALDDLPDHLMPERIIETEFEELDKEDLISISFYIIEPNKSLNLFEVFGGQYKAELIDFIAFCRQGGFHIQNL
jgi:hypothetical protein